MVIWRITDGKAGHDSQSLGLVSALASLLDIEAFTIPAPSLLASCAQLITTYPPGEPTLPKPEMVVGAGRATHLPLVTTRRATEARSIVLMKPSLPLAWFDLCLIPRHDRVSPKVNIIATDGALNTIRAGREQRDNRGLIMIGGPSVHFDWDPATLLAQLETVLARSSNVAWQITDSRRTPETTRHNLRSLAGPKTKYIPHEQTNDAWISQHLDEAATIWVTGDSVSMIYEALSAGGAVGLLEIPPRRDGRLQRGLRELRRRQRLTAFAEWREGALLAAAEIPLSEATRCAALIVHRWFND